MRESRRRAQKSSRHARRREDNTDQNTPPPQEPRKAHQHCTGKLAPEKKKGGGRQRRSPNKDASVAWLSVRCPCGMRSQGTSAYSKAVQGVSKPRATRAGLGEHFPEPQAEACGGSPRRGRPSSVVCCRKPPTQPPKRRRARKAGRFTRKKSKESQPLTRDPRIPETRRKTQELRVVRIARKIEGHKRAPRKSQGKRAEKIAKEASQGKTEGTKRRSSGVGGP